MRLGPHGIIHRDHWLRDASLRYVADALVAMGAVVIDVLEPVKHAGQACTAEAEKTEANAGDTVDVSVYY